MTQHLRIRSLPRHSRKKEPQKKENIEQSYNVPITKAKERGFAELFSLTLSSRAAAAEAKAACAVGKGDTGERIKKK